VCVVARNPEGRVDGYAVWRATDGDWFLQPDQAQVTVDEVLAERRAKMDASERPWLPRDRDRPVSKALRAYAALATSAHLGAVRRVP